VQNTPTPALAALGLLAAAATALLGVSPPSTAQAPSSAAQDAGLTWAGLSPRERARTCKAFYSPAQGRVVLALSARKGAGRAARAEHRAVWEFLARTCA
jgi:hypothetical protein